MFATPFKALPLLLAVAALHGCMGSIDPETPAGSGNKLFNDKATPAEFSVYLDTLCDEITGPGAYAEANVGADCLSCSNDNANHAVDATDATWSVLRYDPGMTGNLVFTAHAPPGIVYPAGTRPAATFSAPRSENDYRVEVRTYLAGALQDQECAQGLNFAPDTRDFIGLEATLPFDTVEIAVKRTNLDLVSLDCGSVSALSISNPGNVTRTSEIYVHAMCHDVHVTE